MTEIKNITEYNRNVGLIIYKLRKEEDISQSELANRMDVDIKTISRLETGKNRLTVNILYKMADNSVFSKQNYDLTDLCRFLIIEPYENEYKH